MHITTYPTHKSNHAQYCAIQDHIKAHLAKRKYTYVEPPTLSPVLIPESYLEMFHTEYRYQDERIPLYMAPSPELFLKRLIVKGFGSCYSLIKCYRNGEQPSSVHGSEFMMLEMYDVGADYMELAEDVRAMIAYVVEQVHGSPTLSTPQGDVDLGSLEYITVKDAFAEYAGISDVFDYEATIAQAKDKGYETEGFTYSDIWSQLYAQEVEPHLGMHGKPTIIYEYPRELAAVTRYNPEKNVAERFELYINGVELGNAGNESFNDAEWQLYNKHFHQEIVDREKAGKEYFEPDDEFRLLLKDLPQCAGIAIGVERLAKVIIGCESIRDLHVVIVEHE